LVVVDVTLVVTLLRWCLRCVVVCCCSVTLLLRLLLLRFVLLRYYYYFIITLLFTLFVTLFVVVIVVFVLRLCVVAVVIRCYRYARLRFVTLLPLRWLLLLTVVTRLRYRCGCLRCCCVGCYRFTLLLLFYLRFDYGYTFCLLQLLLVTRCYVVCYVAFTVVVAISVAFTLLPRCILVVVGYFGYVTLFYVVTLLFDFVGTVVRCWLLLFTLRLLLVCCVVVVVVRLLYVVVVVVLFTLLLLHVDLHVVYVVPTLYMLLLLRLVVVAVTVIAFTLLFCICC